ncbi:MAG: aminotransferase class I/II-fold pyridoxal phosphate-dependent enzyme [Planctomycetota bacterium]
MSPPRPQGIEIDCDATDLVALLRHRAARQGRQRAFTFLVDGEQQRQHLNYAELDRRARSVAAYLQASGLQGERAILLYPSGLEFVAAFFGCLYAGVTAVPIYPPRRNRNLKRIQSIVGDATPAVALTTHSVFDRVEPMIADLEDLRGMPWLCTDDLTAAGADDWADPGVDASTLAFLQYTSGSTGTPKGVMLSHGNLLHNTAVISAAFQPSRTSSGLTWLPLYHDMGLIGGVIQPVYFGRPNTLMTPTHFLQKPVRWLQALSDSGAAVSGGPNFAYELCVERVTEEEKQSLDLSQWEVAFNGAEPVRAETMDRFCKAFQQCGFARRAFYPCYGLAEATLLVAGGDKWTPPVVGRFDAERLKQGWGVSAPIAGPAAGSVAAPAAAAGGQGEQAIVGSGGSLLGQEIVIADPESHAECGAGVVGEVWVSGPSVAQGYWNRAGATQETFRATLRDGRGPFLRTGDLGFLATDADGNRELFVTGRLKDLIIIRGANHYPQDIEETVSAAHESLPASAGAAVSVGEAGAERLVVVQEMGRARDLPFEEIIEAIRRDVTQVHDVAPSAVVLIKPTSIPKTSSGKIQRHACREAFCESELSVVAEWSADGGLKIHRKRGARRLGATAKPAASRPVEPVIDTEAVAASPTEQQAASARSATKERVLEIVRGVAKERARNLTLDTDIAGMGLDSLERMEIVALLEDHFGGRFPEEAILAMETCRDVIDAVEANLLGGKPGAGPRKITPGDYVFAESKEYRKLRENFEMAERMGIKNPYFTRHEGVTNDRTTIGGKEYVNWCSYNYLGMSGDDAVDAAAQHAIDRFGTSVSASRLVSGEKTLHGRLERAIADFIGAEDAIVMVGGHATNETVIGHLLGPGDLILHDALSHNSIVQGCKLSGALRRAFPHNDHRACGELLERYRGQHRRVLIIVEGVYSMDGDYAPVREFVELKAKHKCYLMVDEAHSIGTMGKSGRGMSEFAGVDPRDVDIWMGTLSKSFGSCGGYIAGGSELVKYLKYTAPGFVYSVGLSPPNAAAALASIELLEAEPARIQRLRENSELFLRLAKDAGLNTGMSRGTPVIPVITGNSLHALELSQALFAQGINVQPIMYPAVEEAAARLRFFITATHTEEQIRHTVALLKEAWAELQGGAVAAQRVEFSSAGGGVQQAAARG